MNILTATVYWKRPEKEAFYRALTEFAIDTFKSNLAGDWEYRPMVFGQVANHDMAFFGKFKQLYKWWHEGHNVFSVDADMICVKPIDVFGKYQHLRMFWATDSSKSGLKQVPHYFNSGVLYSPAEIESYVWDFGFGKWSQYLADGGLRTAKGDWAREQDIFNEMFYAQGVEPILANELNYLEPTPELNKIPKDKACILHYWTTRGEAQAFKRMKADWTRAKQPLPTIQTKRAKVRL